MPVIIKPTPEVVGTNTDVTFTSARDILSAASTAWAKGKDTASLGYFKLGENYRTKKPEITLANAGKIVQDKRPILSSSFNGNEEPVAPYAGGFVHSVIRAFQQDLHLVIRPDDLWQAILTQFSFYVAGNAENLRHVFVAHEGKSKVVLDIRPYSLDDLPLGIFAPLMVSKMQEQLLDPKLSEWFLPRFTTTTENDVATASITMMSTMKQYFEFVLRIGCGFPSVTLLGERADWEEIQRRIGQLPQYGPEPAAWAELLTIILNEILNCFDNPESEAAKSFWLRAVHEAGHWGSRRGWKTLSGWLPALCFWDADGKRIPDIIGSSGLLPDQIPLVLNGKRFPLIAANRIPAAVAKVPMVCEDHGRNVKINVEILAGQPGASVLGEAKNTLQPRSGWWMLKNGEEPLVV
ncbi:hypothetical protein HMN09_00316200 [Mycena chlorophos]|uniref:Uncharacterized protein n=1 Tax=Mycena chlorophos TaxID=658473 RepID=A0A8H6TI08_MYCCL|nr:hypothetical protein HMN09_00316200 [Mycena chlorophos]